MCKHGFYVRFMDDWVIMVKTKHQLRKVIKLTHKILNEIKLKMHPDKTFLGCIKKGFDFLGVHFGATPTIATACQEKHRVKLAQRYAQGASAACIGDYVTRWTSWCTSVLRCVVNEANTFNLSMGSLANNPGRPELLKENNYGAQALKHPATSGLQPTIA